MSDMSKALRVSLVVLLTFLGLTAVGGGIGLLTGGGAPGLELLRGSPFKDYTVPGLALLVLVGGGGLAAAVLAARGHALGLAAAGAAGLAIIIFEIVEIRVVGSQTGAALLFQGFGIILGLVIGLLVAALWRMDRGKPSAG